jgi:hypothetical protein
MIMIEIINGSDKRFDGWRELSRSGGIYKTPKGRAGGVPPSPSPWMRIISCGAFLEP